MTTEHKKPDPTPEPEGAFIKSARSSSIHLDVFVFMLLVITFILGVGLLIITKQTL